LILATVGTQLPFDRLIRAVDQAMPGLPDRGVAQVGRSTYRPINLESHVSLNAIEFETLLKEARVIVAHAGIGTLLMAQKHLKPLIICPRRAALGEHRNDHQMATAQAVQNRPGIYIAWNEADVASLLAGPLEPPRANEDHPNRDRLNTALAGFIRLDRGVG
jgi:UDP-N-acetylglucosamine transferase subunit ALG13